MSKMSARAFIGTVRITWKNSEHTKSKRMKLTPNESPEPTFLALLVLMLFLVLLTLAILHKLASLP
jgi:hypothetical protein